MHGAGPVSAFPEPPTWPLRGLRPCHMMAIAAAMKMVEYVPLMIPTSIVNANPSSTSPPKK